MTRAASSGTDQAASPARNPSSRSRAVSRPRGPASTAKRRCPSATMALARACAPAAFSGRIVSTPEQVLADADGPAAGAGEGGDLRAQRVPGRDVVGPAADQDHRTGPLGAHQRDVLALGRLGGASGRHADQQLPGVGDLDEAGRDRGEVRVGDVVHDHAHHRALPGGDGPGLQVSRVAELGDRLVDALRPAVARPAARLRSPPGRRWSARRPPGRRRPAASPSTDS